jgi:hypothetical protein
MLEKGASKVGTLKSIVEARRLQKITTAFLRSVGAVDNPECEKIPAGFPRYPLMLETKAGELMLNADHWYIRGQFQDVNAACELLNPKKQRGNRLCPRTGSWSHGYYQSPMSAAQALDDFKESLLPLLKPK